MHNHRLICIYFPIDFSPFYYHITMFGPPTCDNCMKTMVKVHFGEHAQRLKAILNILLASISYIQAI